MRKLFGEVAAKAGTLAGARAAREEAVGAVQQIAMETAARAAREKLLALASKGQIKLSSAWRPTALIAIIAGRSDLSDMDKIKLAAKAKMEGNLGDLLPKRFGGAKYTMEDDPLHGKLKFTAEENTTIESQENIDQSRKWQTVVFTDLPDEKKRSEHTSSKDNVSSLKQRFETKNMKNNEAYVIM